MALRLVRRSDLYYKSASPHQNYYLSYSKLRSLFNKKSWMILVIVPI